MTEKPLFRSSAVVNKLEENCGKNQTEDHISATAKAFSSWQCWTTAHFMEINQSLWASYSPPHNISFGLQ